MRSTKHYNSDACPIARISMNLKKLVWFGMLVGSTVGGYVPSLWGADMISFSGLFGSFIGGIAGVWAAWKINQMIEG